MKIFLALFLALPVSLFSQGTIFSNITRTNALVETNLFITSLPVPGGTKTIYFSDLKAAIAQTNVGGFTSVQRATLQCDITGANANGDTFCNMVTLSSAFRLNGGKGLLSTFSLLSADDTAPEIDVLVFSRPFTAGATNAVWAVSTAEMAYCLGSFQITAADYTDTGTNRLATRLNLNFAVGNTFTNTALYLGMIAKSVVTVTNQPSITVGILQD